MKERIYLRRLSVLDIFPSVVYNPVRMKKGRDQMERKARRLMMTAGISEMLLAIVGFAAFEWVIYLFFLDYKANLAQSEQPLMMIGFTALMTVFFYFIPFLGILFLLNLITGIHSVCRGAGKRLLFLGKKGYGLGSAFRFRRSVCSLRQLRPLQARIRGLSFWRRWRLRRRWHRSL